MPQPYFSHYDLRDLRDAKRELRRVEEMIREPNRTICIYCHSQAIEKIEHVPGCPMIAKEAEFTLKWKTQYSKISGSHTLAVINENAWVEIFGEWAKDTRRYWRVCLIEKSSGRTFKIGIAWSEMAAKRKAEEYLPIKYLDDLFAAEIKAAS